jgi:hypothetical protein
MMMQLKYHTAISISNDASNDTATEVLKKNPSHASGDASTEKKHQMRHVTQV